MTHKQKVLALLRDRKPHTHNELYALGCVAHSRISDLRRDGYIINQWREDGHYLYQLVGALEEAVGGHGGRGEPGTPLISSGVETPVAASSSAPSPVVPLGEPPSREGALSLFDTPRGAYGD